MGRVGQVVALSIREWKEPDGAVPNVERVLGLVEPQSVYYTYVRIHASFACAACSTHHSRAPPRPCELDMARLPFIGEREGLTMGHGAASEEAKS